MASTAEPKVEIPFDRIYYWKNNPKRLRLNGKACRILERGSSMNAILVEFEDGERVITSRRAVRRKK
jgi:hypothetical protein